MIHEDLQNRPMTIAIPLLVLLALTIPGRPSSADDRWVLRVSGISVTPDMQVNQMDPDGDRTTADSESALGLGVEIEYRLNERLALSAGFLSAEPDIDIRVTSASGESVATSDRLSFRPLSVGLEVHLTPEGVVDLSAGLMIAWVSYGDLVFDAGPDQRLELWSDDDFGWGATLGADMRLWGGPWSIRLSASYMDTTLEVANERDGVMEEVDFDPVILGLGLSYSF